MSYPLDFAHYALEFSDGGRSNKHYNATLLIAPNGMSILVKRWGKIGSIGEMKVEKFAIQKKAESEFEKIVQSKLGKGYETRSHNMKQINAEGELRMAFGPAVWPKLPGSALEHVLPGFDTAGRKELGETRFDENGKFKGDPAPRVFSQAEIAAARAAERLAAQEEAQKTYAVNPNFGRF
ncbi:WGR domain-containing protein [Pararhizobium qamdonense]|uniref:WGR domain-containing protein n=1 Tax=Pararhizobium qamdonense TaxID=3031126 RepID=UPI0023E274CB|nr:WGR domain-containing protein [Pararhizobium qamdonense]